MVDQLYSEDYCDDDLELIELTEADIVEEGEPDKLVERIKPVHQPVVDPWAEISVTGSESVAIGEETVAAPVAAPKEETPQDVASKDPLMTSTLAELYVSQGFIDKALDIYRGMLDLNPSNDSISSRVAELELSSAASGKLSVLPADSEMLSAAAVLDEPTEAPVSADSSVSASVAVLEGWLENIRRLRECR